MAERHMSILGVGPWFVLLSGVYTAAALTLRSTAPNLYSFPLPRWLTLGLGALLLLIGVPFFLAALIRLLRGFPKGELFTGGVYAACRHPIYGAWVVFNVPGIVLLVNTWLGLVVVLLMYVTLRLLVRSEERALERLFGDAYRTYRDRTPAVLPLLWRVPGG
jgi:protein-S-isoprenylcysteine O-methyltransferase Ste14